MQLLLRHNAAAVSGPCALCQQPTDSVAGVQIVEAVAQAPVCTPCARRHSPSLAALAQLADEAQRVGRIGRHTVFPPYTALLDLARAANEFSSRFTPQA